MLKKMKLALLMSFAGTVLLICPKAQSAPQNKTARLKLKGCVIQVEIVDTPRLRERGLSGRKRLAENTGMLFVFKNPDYHFFWMKDMNFALDLIWILNGKIVDITYNVSPAPGPVIELPKYKPSTPVNYVLEVNAGVVQKCEIQIGDKIELPF